MRFMMKGGVWKNTEDEILKAAVMKYGKNQWSRISSLLVRKTAKQCKARWYEWLDPSIKKTEWSRDEEERLLHLAKIMPTQWRTIAPIIGRTAAQCLEHYEKLLDVAQTRDGDDVNSDDPKRLRPGEIDPAPETKPARPDPIDMDEDETEMLSEARARLANTRGKKAKRKAREKQLEEARRLASLQKRRELKAAGINVLRRRFRKRKGVDYMAEIPFYKRQPVGFHDTSREDQLALENKQAPDFRNLTSETFEGKSRDEIEARERKKDLKRQKLFREQNLPAAIAQINRLNDPQTSIRMRNPLILSKPQVSDAELENIARLNVISGSLNPSDGGSSNLISQYGATPTPMRTARTPTTTDQRQQDVHDLIEMTNAQTPLHGGTNAALFNEQFAERASASYTPVQTPSGLRTPSSGSSIGANSTPGSSQPFGSQTPMSVQGTPLRDALGINQSVTNGFDFASATPIEEKRWRKQEKNRQKLFKQQLQSGFANLPAPSSKRSLRHLNVNIIMPVIEDDSYQELEEDAADIDSRRVATLEAVEQSELRRRSQTIQKNLPRPQVVNPKLPRLDRERRPDLSTELSEASDLLSREMLSMMRYDNAKFPMSNSKSKPRIPRFEEFDDADLEEARDLLDTEIAILTSERSEEDEAQLKDFASLWDGATKDSHYLPSARAFGSFARCAKGEQLQCLQQEFELLRAQMALQRKKGAKAEKKLSILTGGYVHRAKALRAEIEATAERIQQTNVEFHSFERLYKREHAAIPRRQETLKRDVQREMDREVGLQERYQNLLDEHQKLEELLAKA
uniref:SANT/Myb domain n=1 Tax=Hirondellea gigas TaxID=1518452 RepID=A0A6A7G905_9CRUS